MVMVVGVVTTAAHVDAASPERPLPMRGADISALSVLEQKGAVYRVDGQPVDAIKALSDHGVNWFRLRLFVDPKYEEVVVNDLPYTIALAKRIKQAGGKLLLDFHYSDTWADPGKQFKPEAWRDLDFPALEQKVESYTREVMEAMGREGVLPEMVQIGNEITGGMLFPDGKLWVDKSKADEEFDRLAVLLKAGIRGARAGAGEKPIQVMIHIARGDRWNENEFYFTQLERCGVEFDLIGNSYYPRYHGTMAQVKDNLTRTVERFKKPIVLVEAGYAYAGEQWEPQKQEYPNTPEGQAQFLRDLMDVVRGLPEGRGLGVFWWYPEAVPLSEPGLVWESGRLGLFDANGEILPAAKVFHEEATAASRTATSGTVR